jgi:tripartite-type tricarboxylate transporter receptor subunit TctC
MQWRAFCRRVVTTLIIFSSLCAIALPALAQQTNDTDKAFFGGKTITYIVATKAGGGYDTYARLIARFLEKYLPGARVQIQNVPGAGHLVGLNQMSVTQADGLTIGTFNTGLIYSQMLGLPEMRVDLRNLDWIGKAASDPRVLVVSTESGIKSLEDLRDRSSPALFASSGIGTASHNETVFLAKALDLDIRVIPGFGGGEGEMAMLRGDIQGTVGSYSSLRPFVENDYGRILLRIGEGGTLGDSVPTAIDLVNNETWRGIITVMQTLMGLGRLTAAPGGVPAPRLAALRQAYAEALADPELLALAAKLQIPINPLPGDAVARRLTRALSQPSEVIAVMRALSEGARP